MKIKTEELKVFIQDYIKLVEKKAFIYYNILISRIYSPL